MRSEGTIPKGEDFEDVQRDSERDKARRILDDMLDRGFNAALDKNWDDKPVVTVTPLSAVEIAWVASYAVNADLKCKIGPGQYLSLEIR